MTMWTVLACQEQYHEYEFHPHNSQNHSPGHSAEGDLIDYSSNVTMLLGFDYYLDYVVVLLLEIASRLD